MEVCLLDIDLGDLHLVIGGGLHGILTEQEAQGFERGSSSKVRGVVLSVDFGRHVSCTNLWLLNIALIAVHPAATNERRRGIIFGIFKAADVTYVLANNTPSLPTSLAGSAPAGEFRGCIRRGVHP